MKGENYFIAFDAKGKEYDLSVQDEPDVPVIVLGSCERLNYNSKTMPIDDGGTGSGGSGGGGTGGGTGGGNGGGSSFKSVHSNSFQFPKLSKIETWIQGGPEIRIGIKTNDGEVDVEKIYYFSRSDVKNSKWFSRNEKFFDWYYSVRESAGFGITEMDNGVPFNFTFGFTFKGFNFSVKYLGTAKDDDLGKDQIYSNFTNYGLINCGDLFKMKIQY